MVVLVLLILCNNFRSQQAGGFQKAFLYVLRCCHPTSVSALASIWHKTLRFWSCSVTLVSGATKAQGILVFLWGWHRHHAWMWEWPQTASSCQWLSPRAASPLPTPSCPRSLSCKIGLTQSWREPGKANSFHFPHHLQTSDSNTFHVE